MSESEVDDFTLNLLKRAKARQQVITENLDKENEDKDKIDIIMKKMAENSPKKNEKDVLIPITAVTTIASKSPIKNKPLCFFGENNDKESTNTKAEVEESRDVLTESSDDDSLPMDCGVDPKLMESYKTPELCHENSTSAIKSETKRTLKRLGRLYSDDTIASPVHQHSALEKTPDCTPLVEGKNRSSPVARRSRLHALACTINEWEDDLSHHCSPSSRFNISVTPKGARGRSPSKQFVASQPNGDTTLVSKLAFTPKQNFQPVTSTPASSTPKVITEVYTDACKTLENETDCSSNNFNDSFEALSKPLCVSTKKDRGLIIERKMYLQNNEKISKYENSPKTKHVWDKSMINALEAQGFVCTPAKDKLVYDYSNATSQGHGEKLSPKKQIDQRRTSPSPKKPNTSNQTLMNRSISPSKPVASPSKQITFESAIAAAAEKISPQKSVDDTPRVVDSIRKKFEFGRRSPSPKRNNPGKPLVCNNIDSTRMNTTVAERAALIETKLNQSILEKDPTELTVAQRARLFESQVLFRTPKVQPTKEPPKPLRSFPPPPPKDEPKAASVNRSAEQPRKLQNTEYRKVRAPSPDETSAEEQEEEMKCLPPPPPLPVQSTAAMSPPRNKRHSKSPTPKRSISPKSKYPGSRDIKRIKINEPKEGRMYPSLTDIETETEAENNFTETEDDRMYEDEDMDSETSQLSASSLGTHIEQVAKLSSPVRSPPRRNRHFRPTEDFSASLACRQIDAYIDEALEGQDYTLDTLIEDELAAHSSSTPIANTSMEKSDDSSSMGTVIAEETRKTIQFALDEMEDNDAENVDANSSFGSFATTRHDLPVRVVKETNVDSEISFSYSCIDDDVETNDNVELKLAHKIQDSNPLSTSSPRAYCDNKGESSPSSVHTPLIHTVSFYRKQQSRKYAVATPTTSHRTETIINSPERNPVQRNDVSGEIKKMEEEVGGHVKTIAQVSKALNLCKSTVEFSQSSENVECEKVLLVATHRRTALLNEIHRLKTEGALSKKTPFSPSKHDLGPSCRGNMTLSNVELQLNRDFISRAIKGDSVYHFILLAKYRHQIEVSTLVSIGNGISSSNIQGGVLHFPNSFTMGNLEPEFCVKLEIYLLQTQKEYLPHEAKYHIKKLEQKTGLLTPKKLKLDAQTAKYLGRPFQQSPAGPDSIRTTNFSLCGNLSIDISTLQRSHWMLEKSINVSPLEGSVSIKIQCSAEGGIEEKGFLTLFEDVSGYGAWHRRWCKLTPSQLQYWRYPEDETKKEPIGAVSLRKCVTNRVGPVSREVCARANTFLLVTTRSVRDDDKDTLVLSCHNEYTAVRHLISADTKEERDAWCKQFNRALANLRAWDPHAHSPDDTMF